MTRLGREVPELPAELLFSDTELRVLAAIARKDRFAAPDNLGTAVLASADGSPDARARPARRSGHVAGLQGTGHDGLRLPTARQ